MCHRRCRSNRGRDAVRLSDKADTLATWLEITGVTSANIDDNEFSTAVTTQISPLATLTTGGNLNSARFNRGFVTEADGITTAIATGATVTHGLSVTPTLVQLTPQDATPTNFYPSALGATTFAVNYAGGGTHVFAWSAMYR